MIYITNYLNVQYHSISDKIHDLENRISTLPDGDLLFRSNGKYTKFYRRLNNKTDYIPSSEILLAKNLAHKKLMQLELATLKERLSSIELLLSHSPENEYNLFKYKSNPRICELLNFDNNNLPENKWSKEKYNTNPSHPEQLSFPCPSGKKVRSKSEVFIDMVLSENNIAYRYECELIIGNRAFYPDFTFKHPITGDVFYWEHFGLMDNEDYALAAFKKLRVYYSYGIFQGKNLITTFESKAKPFSYNEAVAAVSFLLN